MAYKQHLGDPGEGRPVNWKSALNNPDGWLPGSGERREWVEKRAGATPGQTVHLVDDAGNPLSPAATEQLRRTLTTNQKRHAKRQERGQQKAERKQAVQQQMRAQHAAEKRDARHRTIVIGLVFWILGLYAGFHQGIGAGAIALWILMAPIWIYVSGLIGRAMLAMMDL